ncbi:hypothetical protein [Sediminibacterium ginsengisoli]|uniref:Fasciclin domain-containing protein n=1 Tax=Sediminibacterium ginsengisoli TaxID=413434 RepID=A0A1T4KVC8_9BACT|nr:hypothetical protein [Sediminibacterium ginsengisoli]SJZ46356.1 hypothetical protein SAMN04488132_102141 [Sediminibacterium ginsengisoli]
MKKINIKTKGFLLAIGMVTMLSGCYKLQTDYNRTPHTVDPHINRTAWQYIVDRSVANNTDTIFRVMYNAIIYSGMDSNEYKVPNRTFILMNNNSAKAVWTNVKTATNVAGKRWEDYPKDAVKKYLQYLIVQGVYDHYTLPAQSNVEVKTTAPAGSFTTAPTGFAIPNFVTNPNSIMQMQVLNSSPSNTSDYPIQLNTVLNVQTSSILATNGSVHVINGFLTTNTQ